MNKTINTLKNYRDNLNTKNIVHINKKFNDLIYKKTDNLDAQTDIDIFYHYNHLYNNARGVRMLKGFINVAIDDFKKDE